MPNVASTGGVLIGPSGIPPQQDSEESRASAQLTDRERMKSPIVRIELNSPNTSTGVQRKIGKRTSGSVESTDEHIANMPEINNDSMVGDINQLISDLNRG